MPYRSILLLFCLTPFFLLAQIKGKDYLVGTEITIHSKVLDEDRNIQVFLPEQYEESEIAYPVLYILDGQRYFLHGVSLYQSFTNFKETPAFIIVGIDKKRSDRNRLYSSDAQKFLDFLQSEVINHIDTHFRTTDKRLLFGWAYAGGFVLETFLSRTNTFDHYLAASPFPIAPKIKNLDSLFIAQPNLDKSLFFSSGTNEGLVQEEAQQLRTYLLQGAPESLEWTYKELPGEEHRSTPFTTMYHGIKNAFQHYPELQFSSLEDFSKAGGLDYVYDYYEKRSAKYGFPKELSDWTMFSITRNAIRADDLPQFEQLVDRFGPTNFIDRLRLSRAYTIAAFYLKHERYDQALPLFTQIHEKHPEASRPLAGLVTIYEAMGQNEQSAAYDKKLKALSTETKD